MVEHLASEQGVFENGVLDPKGLLRQRKSSQDEVTGGHSAHIWCEPGGESVGDCGEGDNCGDIHGESGSGKTLLKLADERERYC